VGADDVLVTRPRAADETRQPDDPCAVRGGELQAAMRERAALAKASWIAAWKWSILLCRHGIWCRAMKQRYLEVTFRKGKAFAAYLYLPRATSARVARTLDEGRGIHVDLDDSGVPMGIEITAPGAVTSAELNAVLVRHGLPALGDEEWAPLAA
jgi:uncharacterized protein YuzE